MFRIPAGRSPNPSRPGQRSIASGPSALVTGPTWAERRGSHVRPDPAARAARAARAAVRPAGSPRRRLRPATASLPPPPPAARSPGLRRTASPRRRATRHRRPPATRRRRPRLRPGLSAGDRPFSVSDAFNWGWAKFQQNAGAIVVAALIYFVVLAIIEVIAYLIFAGILLSSTTLHVNADYRPDHRWRRHEFHRAPAFRRPARPSCSSLIAAVVQVGDHQRRACEIANGKKVEIGDFFKFEKIGPSLTAGLMVARRHRVGTFLCYIPALVVAFFTPFYLFFIIDKNLAPWDAIKASVALVSNNIGLDADPVIIGVIIAYIVGAIICLVGLFVTMPVALLALTFAYRKFQNEPVAA